MVPWNDSSLRLTLHIDNPKDSNSTAFQIARLLRQLERDLSSEQYILLKNEIRAQIPLFVRPVVAAKLRELGVEL
jgi:hypothetical protein